MVIAEPDTIARARGARDERQGGVPARPAARTLPARHRGRRAAERPAGPGEFLRPRDRTDPRGDRIGGGKRRRNGVARRAVLHPQPCRARRRRRRSRAHRGALDIHGPVRRRHDRARPDARSDRTTWTGSIHIVDLPNAEAARVFVEHEPYNRAGLFEHHLIRRFTNLLGRTMWEFPAAPDNPRFMVIAHAPAFDLPPRTADRLRRATDTRRRQARRHLTGTPSAVTRNRRGVPQRRTTRT